MFRIPSPAFPLMLAPIVLLAACGDEVAGEAGQGNDSTAASSGLDTESRLAAAVDRSWINLSGTIVSTAPNAFVLDYGKDNVTVEMDDWDWYREGQALAPGDPVVVTGRVDADLWRSKRIEASSVYARNLNSYFFASGADEEDLASSTVYVAPTTPASDSTGYVSAVEGQEFTIGNGAMAIRVDASGLPASKRPAIKVGDRVYAWGDLDLDRQEQAEIMAKGIVLLAKDRTKVSGGSTGMPGNSAASDKPAEVPVSGNSASTQP